MRVLIVEDDPVSRGALRDLLEGLDHHARAVASVGEALAVCAALDPHLLILDYALPDGNGLDVVRRLASAGALPARVWLVTAHELSPMARELANDLRVRLFRKPLTPREFLASVREPGQADPVGACLPPE